MTCRAGNTYVWYPIAQTYLALMLLKQKELVLRFLKLMPALVADFVIHELVRLGKSVLTKTKPYN